MTADAFTDYAISIGKAGSLQRRLGQIVCPAADTRRNLAINQQLTVGPGVKRHYITPSNVKVTLLRPGLMLASEGGPS